MEEEVIRNESGKVRNNEISSLMDQCFEECGKIKDIRQRLLEELEPVLLQDYPVNCENTEEISPSAPLGVKIKELLFFLKFDSAELNKTFERLCL